MFLCHICLFFKCFCMFSSVILLLQHCLDHHPRNNISLDLVRLLLLDFPPAKKKIWFALGTHLELIPPAKKLRSDVYPVYVQCCFSVLCALQAAMSTLSSAVVPWRTRATVVMRARVAPGSCLVGTAPGHVPGCCAVIICQSRTAS